MEKKLAKQAAIMYVGAKVDEAKSDMQLDIQRFKRDRQRIKSILMQMTEVFKMPHILSLNILIGTRAYQKHRALKYLNDQYDIKIAQTKGLNSLNSEGQRIIESLK